MSNENKQGQHHDADQPDGLMIRDKKTGDISIVSYAIGRQRVQDGLAEQVSD